MMVMAKKLGCEWIGAIPIHSNSSYNYDDCHNSVMNYVSIYGGRHRVGYYFVEGFGDIQAILHSVWECNENLIDIMPYRDNREYNIFGLLPYGSSYNLFPNAFFRSFDKYIKQENELMYYVYQLVDPRDNQPFYIGKGTGKRAKTHLWGIARVQNEYKDNKIQSIRDAGYEPRIEYVVENIIDEELAYTIERDLIQRYGRKGYEANGILTNACIDNRPPNHKGKTYEEIYGDRATEQREKRRQLQIDAGGWFKGRTHSAESKKIFSEKTKGKNNPRYGVKVSGTETAKKISDAHIGKKHYDRKDVKLLFVEGLNVFIYSNDLKQWALDNGYSYATFRSQLEKNWQASKRGMNVGLRVRIATPEEVVKYKSSLESGL